MFPPTVDLTDFADLPFFFFLKSYYFGFVSRPVLETPYFHLSGARQRLQWWEVTKYKYFCYYAEVYFLCICTLLKYLCF